MEIYYPLENRSFSIEDFVNYFSDSYYLGNEKRVHSAQQSSKSIEKEIERLLKCGIKSKADIIHILAWKMNGINHAESERASKEAGKPRFIYKTYNKPCVRWNENEKCGPLEAVHWGRQIVNLQPFVDFIFDNINENRWDNQQPQTILNELNSCLNNNNVKYIGTVYLITLLYFISKGKYPIYDRFAMLAINRICAQYNNRNHMQYNGLPERSNASEFSTLMTNSQYVNYLQDLRKLFFNEHYQFGDCIEKERDVDRALWVYGHIKL